MVDNAQVANETIEELKIRAESKEGEVKDMRTFFHQLRSDFES